MRAALTPGGVSMAGVQRKLEQEKYEARHTPRMIFAMDATASREPTWEMAGKLHREMGAALGNLTLQLTFFFPKAGDECRASTEVGDRRPAPRGTDEQGSLLYRIYSDRTDAATCHRRRRQPCDPRVGLCRRLLRGRRRRIVCVSRATQTAAHSHFPIS